MTRDGGKMARLLSLTVIWTILGLSASQHVEYTERYFDQYVDHFNLVSFGDKTYKQRYLVQDKWYQNGTGAIFFYTGNEGPIDAFWNATGFVFDIAPDFGALVVFAEHRFYGKSIPFGEDVCYTHPYIGLLTVEQAMADFAVLIQYLKTELKAPNIPVIAFGGSYGGMLSAFMRFKYPNMITGSIAASAPIFLLSPDLDRKFFFEDVTKDFHKANPECEERVQQGFVVMKAMAAAGPKGLKMLSSYFSTCSPLQDQHSYLHLLGWIRNAFVMFAMLDYPYPTNFLGNNLPAYPVKAACELIVQSGDLVEGLAKAAGMFYNVSGTKCFDIFKDYVECADPSGCGVGPDSRSWDFQACTEIRLNDGSDNVTDMFPVLPFDAEIRKAYCQKTWNVTPRDSWGQVQFWDKHLETTSNIVFSNGDLDPWRRGGVLSSSNPGITVILVEGGAHHLDLRGHNRLDPPSVVSARRTERALIGAWIKSHYKSLARNPGISVQ